MVRIIVCSDALLLNNRLKEYAGSIKNAAVYDSLSEACFEDAMTTSLFGSKCIIVKMDTFLGDKNTVNALNAVPDDTLFLIAAKDADKRSAAYKEYAKSIEFIDEYSASRKTGAINAFIEKNQISITDEAREMLIAYTQELDLCGINKILSQLRLYDTVTSDMIQAVVPVPEAHDVFRWAGLWGKRRDFCSFGYKLYQSGENAITLLSLLSREFRVGYKAMLLSGTASEISKELGVPEFIISQIKRGNETKEGFYKRMSVCNEAIRNIKLGLIPERLAFSQTVALLAEMM